MPGAPEFESWVFQEQQSFERHYLEALAALVEVDHAHGRLREAIGFAELYLETSELAEEMHRRLIELYAMAGDRAAAVRQYERCAYLLDRELGVLPLPETEAAYQAVLRGEAPGHVTPTTVAPHRPGSLPDSPLIGREDAWQTLNEKFEKARAGSGTFVLLSGEAGIGKSRLMVEFAEKQAARSTLLMAGCHHSSQAVPYLPLVEALRPHLRTGDLVARVDSIWLAEASGGRVSHSVEIRD